MLIKREALSITLSAALHLLLFLLCVFFLNSKNISYQIEGAQEKILPAFLYEASAIQPTEKSFKEHTLVSPQSISAIAKSTNLAKLKAATLQKAATTQHHKPLMKKPIEEKKATLMHKVLSASSKMSLTNGTKGETRNELIARLHAAIQKHQQYPQTALDLEREGRVTLQFILYTDGSISDLKIAQSSGTLSLDNAALTAIKNAVPFAEINHFLQKPQAYQIDVVFELT